MRKIMDWIFPQRCILCCTPISSKHAVCSPCAKWILSQTPVVRRQRGVVFSVSPFAYEGAVRDALKRFKFARRDHYACAFAEWMTIALRDTVKSDFDLATWVPVGFFRNWGRGYDQGKLLCREVARHLGLGMRRCLFKRYDNRKQSKLSAAERQKNVENVYRILRGADLHGKRVLLVDDVTTTGATLRKCASLLRQAGAKEVVCLTFATAR